ncbi:ribbon-helix-helix protein, copG family [Anaerolinea thermolimosa]|uniref:ribbon-helix-helix protein, CopG family n=1 Tax=Anaerolinea thermolimosa TaxID=229919 RepID=UPI0007861D43|nr:ribbon-helix-helix protein, CopG family [Anaerolinea thermolimosa]GAP06171.1 ribbon-helix-helix protein, copG family [Anaerolinea thermolimosa]
MKRNQLILDEENDRRLREMASREGKSLSEVIRQILDEYFAERERKERERSLQALRKLDRIREETARYGVYEGDPVNEAREERDAEVEDVWRQWS